MPGDFGGPVCSCAPFFYLCTRDRGCTVHPAFPRALCFRGCAKIMANLEQCLLRDREPMSLNYIHSSCPDLIRASIKLHKSLCEGDGLPGHRRAEATPSFRRLCPAMTNYLNVIACDKREAFAQGSSCDEAIQSRLASLLRDGLFRGACHRACIHATRRPAMTF